MINIVQVGSGLRGRLYEWEPMSRHTTWRVGGPADRFYEPADIEDLIAFIRQLPLEEPVVWVGLGSNLLVRDGGIQGTVICTVSALGRYKFIDDSTIRVEAGVPCAKVARITAKAGYTGAEFLAGIPGTMGGALTMNAGAFDGETWRLVIRVETLDRYGHRQLREPHEFEIGYREVKGLEEEWFLTADLGLIPDPERMGLNHIRSLLARRAKTQPIRHPSCGSVFRNPSGDYAARLIESSGLKGLRIGDAGVSDKHANFMINLGKATAADIEALIEWVRNTVEAVHGVRLVSEVKIVGEALG